MKGIMAAADAGRNSQGIDKDAGLAPDQRS